MGEITKELVIATGEKITKVIVSDLHMGSGARSGIINSYEDFYHDSRFVELLRYYSSEDYENRDVEFIINGDFMDLLKVRYRRKFITKVTENIAVDLVRQVIEGHPEVFDALAEFLYKPSKSITYIMGNHDMAICFKAVQNLIRMRLLGKTEDSAQDKEKFKFITDRDYYRLPGGVFVMHGNNFEAMNRIDYKNLFITGDNKEAVLNYTWGNEFVASVLAPLKAERPLIDLVKPLSSFIFYGLIFDVRFTLKVLVRMVYYFIKTRFALVKMRERGFIRTIQILLEELRIFGHPETMVESFLESRNDIQILIMGHTHGAKIRRLRGNKIYINTGTWIKLVNLDYRDLGTRNLLSIAVVEYGGKEGNAPRSKLIRWRGKMHECEELYH